MADRQSLSIDVQFLRFFENPTRAPDQSYRKRLAQSGVSTKFQKAALTTFLNIPELLKVAREWDDDVRKQYPAYQTWFAPIRTKRGKYGEFYFPETKASPYRSKELRREMKRVCEKAVVTFLSAHKLRHGHAVYRIKHAQNIKELKAISQNMMHSSITITDSIYGNLTGNDFSETISGIGVSNIPVENEKEISTDLIRAILKLQDNPILLKKVLNSQISLPSQTCNLKGNTT